MFFRDQRDRISLQQLMVTETVVTANAISFRCWLRSWRLRYAHRSRSASIAVESYRFELSRRARLNVEFDRQFCGVWHANAIALLKGVDIHEHDKR